MRLILPVKPPVCLLFCWRKRFLSQHFFPVDTSFTTFILFFCALACVTVLFSADSHSYWKNGCSFSFECGSWTPGGLRKYITLFFVQSILFSLACTVLLRVESCFRQRTKHDTKPDNWNVVRGLVSIFHRELSSCFYISTDVVGKRRSFILSRLSWKEMLMHTFSLIIECSNSIQLLS